MTAAVQASAWAWRLWVWQAWAVAMLWLWRGLSEVFRGRTLPNLLRKECDAAPLTGPSLVVVVPALNEEANVGACLESLLRQEYESMEIVAVDDRSTDKTGAIMDALAAALPDLAAALPGLAVALPGKAKRRMRVIHVKELPQGWLGKTHAMGLAARSTASEYILFTDADVIFKPDALRRSMAYAVASGADHLVTMPTLDVRRWDEAALLGIFQMCALWAARPWKVADPEAKRDAVGIGAFNLLRRRAYEEVGGFEALKMAVVEDVSLGRRVKSAGLAQRIAFGRDLVRVHWASGATGLVRVLTKNMFAAFDFRVVKLLGACVGLVGLCLLPWIDLGFAGTRLPAAITLLTMAIAYRAVGRNSGIPPWSVLLSQFATMLMVYTLLRSMATTLRQGGIVWRGTFYSLKELRENAVSLW